jgi:hypothetical protein
MCRKACYDTEAGEVYCPECAPDIEPEYMGQETDSPLHCAVCRAPLEYSLTSDGVAYVMSEIVDQLRDGIDETITLPGQGVIADGDYYIGMPHCSVVGDWAREIKWYGGLSPADEYCRDLFLERVEDAERRALDASTVRPDVPSA